MKKKHKSIFKKWWFWLIIVGIIVISLFLFINAKTHNFYRGSEIRNTCKSDNDCNHDELCIAQISSGNYNNNQGYYQADITLTSEQITQGQYLMSPGQCAQIMCYDKCTQAQLNSKMGFNPPGCCGCLVGQMC